MPKLVRLYIRSVATGFVLSGVFCGLLVWLDVAGLGHLIGASEDGLLALVILVVLNGIVFAAVQFAYAVMALAEPDGPRGGLGDHAGPIPSLAAATTARGTDRIDRPAPRRR